MGERCTECGDHTSVPYCPGCRIKELDERERETIARVVAWLISQTVAYGEQPNLERIADAIERGDWKGGDDGR